MTSATLWDIEQSVAQLMALLDDPEIAEEERAVAVAELERWVCAEVRKVDAIRAVLRNCDQREAEALAAVADARQELERQRARAAVFSNRRDRIKAMVMAAMGAMGLRKIEGKTGRLRIQDNGGKQALKITNEPLVPDEYRVFSFRLSATQWQFLQRLIGSTYADSTPAGAILRAMLSSCAPSIDEAKVRAALESKCPICEAMGDIASNCSDCNGTGKQRVPGAELEAKGEHLRVE